MLVLKFGGTSVTSKNNLKNIFRVLNVEIPEDSLLVFVSAFFQISKKLNRMADLGSLGDFNHKKCCIKSYQSTTILRTYFFHKKRRKNSYLMLM